MTSLFVEFRSKFRKSGRIHFKGFQEAFTLFQEVDRMTKPWLEDEDLEPPVGIID